MSNVRKDGFGQEISVGDVIAYGSSSRYAGVKVGLVLSFTPKMIRTSVGNIDDANCVVMTEQVKKTKPEWLASQLDKYKDKLDTTVTKVKDRIEYTASIYVDDGNNYSTYDINNPHYIVVTKWINGTPNHLARHHTHKLSHLTHIRPHKVKVKWRTEKTGKLTTYKYNSSKSETILSQKLVKLLCKGDLPENSTIVKYNSGNDFIGELGDSFVIHHNGLKH